MGSFSGSIGSLWIEIGAHLEGVEKALSDLSTRVGAAIKDTESQFDGLSKLGDRLTSVGIGLSAAITAPLLGIGAAAISAQGDFEHSMNKVSALGEITGKDLEKLTAQALKLGADTQFSAKQAADGMAELAAAGLNAVQIGASMKGVLDLAAAGELSIAQAAKVATDAMSQFGLQAADSAKVADVLAQAAASSKDNVSGLGTALSYVGAPAKAVGLSLQETAAALTLVAEGGLRGERAGTALRSILQDLVKPTKAAQKEMEAMGITFTDAGGKMLPFANILDQLKAAHLGLAQAATLVGTEGSTALLGLAQQGGGALRKLTTEMQNSEGAAARMAGTLNSGISGAFERMKGSIETASISLGKVLEPAIVSIAGAMEGLANKVGEFVQFFGTLPQPVQNAALAFTALVAAIGPLTLGLGALLTAFTAILPALDGIALFLFGGTAAAGSLVAPALAIAAVTAALVALGTWVYANWEPIVKTLTQAFDGLKEMWSAEWGAISGFLIGIWQSIAGSASTYFAPLAPFFSTVWDGIKASTVFVWNDIAKSLTGVWDGIKNAANTIWSGIVSVFQDFIKWAEKIPGVSKLLTLDEAWKGATKAGEAFKTTTEATKALGDAATKTGATAMPKLTKGTGDASKKTTELTEGFAKAAKKADELYATAEILNGAYQKHVKSVAEAKLTLAQWGDKIPEVQLASDALNKSIQDFESHINLAGKAIPGFTVPLQGIIDQTLTLDANLAKLGIKSATEYQTVADNAKKAYDAIAGSGVATDWEKNNAMIKVLEAQRAAMVANGQQIPADFQAMLDKLNSQVVDPSKGLPKATTAFGKFGTEVSTVITNFSQDIVKSLFEGGGSFADKGLKALQSLGEAVLAKFTEPFAKAATDLMGGVINDLLGGKGFGGLIDKVKDLGSSIAGVFGGGASAAGSAAGSAGSAAGSAGSAAGSAGSGASGAASSVGGVVGAIGVAGAIGSVVSAVSGIIGNFQNARQENTLNAIEESTRYTKIYTGGQSQSILWSVQTTAERLDYVNGSLDDIRNKLTDWLSPLPDILRSLDVTASYTIKRLDQIGNDVLYGSQADQSSSSFIGQILTELRNRKDPVVQVFINNQPASNSGVTLKLQGAIGL
jgi:TP901 family phage tail tape measure protein